MGTGQGASLQKKDTSMSKYLFLYRMQQTTEDRPRSADELKAMFARWDAWKSQFKNNILDVGDGLKATGRVLRSGAVTDGPHVESKEVIAGYSMIQAESYEAALTVAKASPITAMPGAYTEIRELAQFM
jgi:hypothetical protein